MECVTDREDCRKQQQQRQKGTERRSRHAASAGRYSSQLHDGAFIQAHAPPLRKLDILRAAILRQLPWPKPIDETIHRFRCEDARNQSWLAN